MSTFNPLRCSRVLLFLLLLSWCICIVWLSLIPHPEKVLGFKAWDKLEHAAAYGVLAFLMAQVFQHYDVLRRLAWRWAVAAAWCFGLLMEIGQVLFTRSRKASLGDLLANTFGILIAYLVGNLLMEFRRRMVARRQP